jgi:CHAT domain-containing protein/tetratricopeptide (TPR) repeat protein
LNDLAASDVRQGDYSAARLRYEGALKIYERHLGRDHIGVTTAVFNLAVVNNRLGDFSEARRQFNRAIMTWERVVGPDHPNVALALSALGEMLTGRGLFAEATAFYERALAIRERSMGKNHRDVAQSLTLLATCLAKLGQIRRANELSERALAIWELSSERQSLRFADALRVHGTLQAQQGNLAAAAASYDRSLLILRRIVGNSHPDVAVIRGLQAAALASGGQMLDALGGALDAEEIGRTHLRLMLRDLPERQGLQYAAKRPKGLDFALSLVATGMNGEEADRVFDGLIRGRSVVLDEMAIRRHLSADAARTDLAPLWTTLVSARQRFANLVIRGPDEQHPERSTALLNEARREKEEAERAFADKSATFRDELVRDETGAKDVQAALPAGSALITFAKYDRTVLSAAPAGASTPPILARPAQARRTVSSYVAFVVRAGHPEVTVVPVGSGRAIDELVAKWRGDVLSGVPEGSSRTAGAGGTPDRASGAALRQRIWDPFAGKLHGVQTVFIVPDGTLSLVSWAALPIGKTQYLIEGGRIIHYLSAERDLVTKRSASPTGNGLLAVGGPAFDDRNPATATPQGSRRSLPSPCVSLQTVRFSALPASLREAREVADVWKTSDDSGQAQASDVLLGRLATERTFKEQASGRRVLHLATHGFFLGDTCQPTIGGTRAVGGLAARKPPDAGGSTVESPLLLSGLAFAGANRRGASKATEEDGILTAEEVASLNLESVQWAVLSACDTGLGEIRAGEGVFGLRRAFQIAGARTVIMSLWSVDDEATRLWMRALYEGRLKKHLSTADAMQQASLGVLRARRARGETTHPFYWAGFVAAGDWQ